MGSSAGFSSHDWDRHTSSVSSKSTYEIFGATSMKSTSDPRTSFDPKTIGFRESRDPSPDAQSTPIIIALDVTGSMHAIPDYMVREGLGPTFAEIYDRKPVSDPQIMFAAIGDADYDQAPLQVTQFENDIRLADQLSDIYLEGGGGGNMHESYTMAWYFAATRTRCDSIEKGRRKGILFTIGDEMIPAVLTRKQVQKFIGDELPADLSAKDLYAMVSKQFDVYHIVVEEGSNYRADPDGVLKSWRDVIGQNVIRLKDHTKLSEVIVSTLQVLGGEDLDAVAKSWTSKGTSLVVHHALSEVVAASAKRPLSKPGSGGVASLDT